MEKAIVFEINEQLFTASALVNYLRNNEYTYADDADGAIEKEVFGTCVTLPIEQQSLERIMQRLSNGEFVYVCHEPKDEKKEVANMLKPIIIRHLFV